MSDQDGSEYSIGFKKPPKHARFKPGQSGNPKGRPKKTDTMADVLQKSLPLAEVRIPGQPGSEKKRDSLVATLHDE